jgi:hypothetical protein
MLPFTKGSFSAGPKQETQGSHTDCICDRHSGTNFRFVRIGCIFEIARCELRFLPIASVGCLANYPAIIERSLYPFGAAAAPMIDICMSANV